VTIVIGVGKDCRREKEYGKGRLWKFWNMLTGEG